MPETLSSDDRAFMDALPESGDVTYAAVRSNLLSAGNKRVLNRFHDLRRTGVVYADIRVVDGERVLFVSRQPFAQMEGSA